MAGGLGVAGLLAIFSTVLLLWALWVTDPLKSIGGFVPIVSAILIARVWRSLGWEMDGTWWGLVLLAATVALVHVRDHAVLELILTPAWTIFLPPHSAVAVAYTAGVVLLFGGTRLFRAALFPIVLMWFVNPVPNTFNLWIDLPLQHASAMIARGFAHALGQPLTAGQLQLMFTPSFGMFIAPGCNGIRGAITMGFMALIAGYLYRFKRVTWALTVAGAVLLGYVFNLVRLCVLVLYYIVALHVRWLQSRAEMGDYIIGACLFFVATILLFTVIRRASPTHDLRPPVLESSADREDGFAPRSFVYRWAAFALLVAVGGTPYARAMMGLAGQPRVATDPQAMGMFPQQAGAYKLEREWNEYLPGGALIFYWADYRPVGGGPAVSVGISPVLGAHDTLICHSARGEDWLWHGDLLMPTVGTATNFSGSLFNDGSRQYLEATTMCSGDHCGQFSSNRTHFGLIYSKPDTNVLLSPSPSRPIPVLLRTETPDAAMAPDLARAQLTATLRSFLTGVDLEQFTKPYR
jgi:exosortase J